LRERASAKLPREFWRESDRICKWKRSGYGERAWEEVIEIEISMSLLYCYSFESPSSSLLPAAHMILLEFPGIDPFRL
jgi:hypothetical protein